MSRMLSTRARSTLDWGHLGVLVLAALLLARLWLAIDFPLTDTTEARYGEMARKMVETADWITPQHDYGVPYWAKPPLALWLAAAGIASLGATELAPRLPILLLSVFLLGALFAWLRREVGSAGAAAGVAITASSLLFYVSMAAVMTDMVLTVCVACALMAFWLRQRGEGWPWEVALYGSLGLGLLAKGPLAGILVVGPIILWSLLTGRVRSVWRQFAWLRGMLMVAAVAMPWYLAAELKTPGFLRYFIVGEHLGRFLIPGWDGDLYGNAHDEPLGMIWAFFFAGMLPWSLLLPPIFFLRRKVLASNWAPRRDLIVFGLAWALVPLLLFTPSANIISPYVLPAVPGAVIAFAGAYTAPRGHDRPLLAMFCAAAAVLTIASFAMNEAVETDTTFASEHTQKPVIEAIRRDYPDACNIYYWRDRWFSAEYYSGGNAREIQDVGSIDAAAPLCVVVPTDALDALPDSVRDMATPAMTVGAFTVLGNHHES